MNKLEAKCYLTKKGGANKSDHTCTCVTLLITPNINSPIKSMKINQLHTSKYKKKIKV